MDPFDFVDEDTTTDELHDLVQEYITTCSNELQGERVGTHRVRRYIGTGRGVNVDETTLPQYSTAIQVRDAFVNTKAGAALRTYLADEHDFEPNTMYLSNLLRHALQQLNAVSVTENEPGDGEQKLQIDVESDEESLLEVVDRCVSILTADIHEQDQYTLRLALAGPIVEEGDVEIDDTHRLRGLDDGLLLREERVSNTAAKIGKGTNPRSWASAAEIDMSTNHPFSETPGIAGEFLAIVLSVFSRSWVSVKNIHTVKRTFYLRTDPFPPRGKSGASFTEIKPEHGPKINALRQLLLPYCGTSATLNQANPYFIDELFSPPINLALHHYGEALIRANLTQSSTALILFGLEALYKQFTEGATPARDVARYAAFTISQATVENMDSSKVMTDINEAYHYRDQWAHGQQTVEVPEELQNRMYDYLRYAIVVFAWIEMHTDLMTPHLDIETAFIDESTRTEFVDSLTALELTDYLRVLPASQ